MAMTYTSAIALVSLTVAAVLVWRRFLRHARASVAENTRREDRE